MRIEYRKMHLFALSATPTTPAHTDQIGEMQIVNRPRKEGPSKNVMLLSQGRTDVMQLTQVLNAQAQKKVYNKRESVLQLNC